MFNTTMTPITSTEDFETQGLTNFNFNSNGYIQVFGLPATSDFRTSNTYLTKDEDKNTYLLTKTNSNLTASVFYTTQSIIYDKDNDIIITIPAANYIRYYQIGAYSSNWNNTFSSSELSLFPNSYDYIRYGQKPITTINNIGGTLGNLKGANQYLYTPIMTADGYESDKIVHLRAYSGGTMPSSSIFNTDIEMANGDILTPIYNGSISSETTNYGWVCTLKPHS